MRPAQIRRLAEFEASLAAWRNENIGAQKLNPNGVHYRMVGVHGLVVDVWPTTGRWMRQGSRIGGTGMEGLLKALREEHAEETADMVTIFTDASYDHRDRSAGYAAWCKTGGGAGELISGQIKSGPLSAEIAEAMAIANALFQARRKGIIKKGAKVMVQSDCINALAKIRTHVPGSKSSPAPGGLPVGYSSFPHKSNAAARRRQQPVVEQYKGVLDSVCSLVLEMNLVLLLRHVKAHTGKSDPRSYVNRICDAAARERMKEMRAGEAA
ncbi:RNaseH [Caulobacter phage Sansa]|uniref:RNaseH n=1 Tax=Caulobacter phage Sansa TaxID=1675600 RepID=A0A0K1LLY4_9CAUD|nr:Rnase H [Caulobacter phage Sansa]AKU43464.1 RNaseH [Caulobacter phage Sansa]